MSRSKIDKALVILRGLPGSGKSTLADFLADDTYPTLSIDDYFTNEQGEYQFIHSENHLAYKACEENVKRYMEEQVRKIFLHNVFSLEWELEPYFKLASTYDYSVFVVTVENRHAGENKHGISALQLEKMAEKYKVKLL